MLAGVVGRQPARGLHQPPRADVGHGAHAEAGGERAAEVVGGKPRGLSEQAQRERLEQMGVDVPPCAIQRIVLQEEGRVGHDGSMTGPRAGVLTALAAASPPGTPG